MINPADKHLLQDYRIDMRTADSPQFIDTQAPIVPVKVIGSGFPKPNTKQTVRQYSFVGTTADVQIATSTATRRVYFLGVTGVTASTGGATIIIGDASTGTLSQSNGSTNILYYYNDSSGNTIAPVRPQYPIECFTGLRITITSTNASRFIIYYMEEEV